MIYWKDNIASKLKENGYSSYRLKKDSLLSGSTVSKIMKQEMCDLYSIDKICSLLNCQPGDLIAWKSDDIPSTKEQAEMIREFKKLLDEGAITQEEFNRKKKKILNL